MHPRSYAATRPFGAVSRFFRSTLVRDIAFFVAIVSTALALGGALAHLFELPNKMSLSQDRYFIVQQIYRGWWQLAYLLVAQLAATVALIVLSKDEPAVRRLAVVALLSLLAAQAAFWMFTQPANLATDNWTTQPADWEALRRRWEYSHAVGALFQLLSMAALAWAAVVRTRPIPPRRNAGVNRY